MSKTCEIFFFFFFQETCEIFDSHFVPFRPFADFTTCVLTNSILQFLTKRPSPLCQAPTPTLYFLSDTNYYIQLPVCFLLFLFFQTQRDTERWVFLVSPLLLLVLLISYTHLSLIFKPLFNLSLLFHSPRFPVLKPPSTPNSPMLFTQQSTVLPLLLSSPRFILVCLFYYYVFIEMWACLITRVLVVHITKILFLF